jgi:hypothetical protein
MSNRAQFATSGTFQTALRISELSNRFNGNLTVNLLPNPDPLLLAWIVP